MLYNNYLFCYHFRTLPGRVAPPNVKVHCLALRPNLVRQLMANVRVPLPMDRWTRMSPQKKLLLPTQTMSDVTMTGSNFSKRPAFLAGCHLICSVTSVCFHPPPFVYPNFSTIHFNLRTGRLVGDWRINPGFGCIATRISGLFETETDLGQWEREWHALFIICSYFFLLIVLFIIQ